MKNNSFDEGSEERNEEGSEERREEGRKGVKEMEVVGRELVIG